MSKYLIVMIGPTAIGKTALSIKIANYFNTEILSADSRQFYKEMFIGTAVPSPEELHNAQHHFIQHISIHDKYTVGDFEKDAIECLKTIFIKHNVAVMVGGSGLYIDAVTKGLDSFPEIDPKVRLELNIELEQKGLSALANKLKTLDPQAYDIIEIDNPHRVIRALEVTIGSSQPYSDFLNNPKPKRNFEIIKIGLTAERPIIYNRINERVDQMMNSGLLNEAKLLLPHKHLNALNTVGYKELFAYLEGETDLEFAISEIKKNTRRFAKRQLTWFRKDDSIEWFDYKTDTNIILEFIKSKINE
ncbi:tRNA (adenosine(37)-N6)-dimethylallyltransferase MiaA [Paucihalobacter ruber]|uniref:tRNA dimethylallyltransferase n=1 Tax=Paucihalobacter ruber TaxID=2567861 RepID=A0A506PEM9_9FLAO|nr:tRNA (adenosine(37)-N6)-dimethylallyltransferase MiaA [Paucihalobacter ruber]TPV32296.1 tRNA (adenosine(37)-N6)-dimethylallyltransferase MiaA [Paucihalobacter ruber]